MAHVRLKRNLQSWARIAAAVPCVYRALFHCCGAAASAASAASASFRHMSVSACSTSRQPERDWPTTPQSVSGGRRVRRGGGLASVVAVAVGETVILLRPPLPLVHSRCCNRDKKGASSK